MRSGDTRGPNRLLRFLNRLYCCLWQRLPRRQRFHLPEGPVILVGNHLAGVDPLLIQAAVDRPLCFLMSREYYSMRGFRWLFDMVGAIPVNPGGANRHALQAVIEAVRAGQAVCLFPEGAANPPVPMLHVLPGAVVLAHETGAPVIPFRVTGVWPFDHKHVWTPFLRRGRARIRIGRPMPLPVGAGGREEMRKGAEAIRQAIRRLRFTGRARN
ncbi:MAG TPA: lysophospholipid acyltransferase family protein [Mariprofundaceae bacterium]|nr:lysophospholipid acyltransferase family protein [Mariprofundaceae bacterium]